MRKWGKVLLALLLLAAVLVGCGQNVQAAWQEQYDLGMRLLSEQNYEEAILAFREAIRIDPKREEAYIGLADVYLAQGDAAAALAAVEEGIAQCGESENLTAKRDEAQTAVNEAETVEEEEPQATPVSDPNNLTGQAAFNEMDCEEWGFPWGCTLYDLADSGMELDCIEPEGIEAWTQKQRDNWPMSNHGGTAIRTDNPHISAYCSTEDFYIWYIEAKGADTFEGPRGVKIGMSLKEVLEKFRCENPIALEYAETLSQELVRENFEDWDNDGDGLSAYLYQGGDEQLPENIKRKLETEGKEKNYIQGLMTVKGDSGYLFYVAQAGSQYSIFFENGSITGYQVSYYNLV